MLHQCFGLKLLQMLGQAVLYIQLLIIAQVVRAAQLMPLVNNYTTISLALMKVSAIIPRENGAVKPKLTLLQYPATPCPSQHPPSC